MRLDYISVLMLALLPLFQSPGYSEELFILHVEGTLGEGIPVITSTGFPLALYREPDESSGMIKFISLPRGETLRAKETDCAVIIRKAGVVRVETTTSVEAESYGNLSFLPITASAVKKNFTFPGGSTFDYLSLASNGSCFIRVLGEILSVADCEWAKPDSKSTSLTIQEQAVVERWMKADEGWVRIDGAKLPFDLQRKEVVTQNDDEPKVDDP